MTIPDTTLLSEINEVEKNSGALLIPSFSVERTQTLLHKIAHFKKDNKVREDTPVYMDSPMAERVTEIYKKFPDLYNPHLADEARSVDPFSFPGLHVIGDYKQSQGVKEQHGAKVIIAGSGMMSGGRILEHAAHFLPIDTTRLLIVGFQAENTIGRQIEEGATAVDIYGDEVKIAASVNSLHSMSAHADQKALLKWLRHIKDVKKVFLVHGENDPREVLKEEIAKLGINDIFLPKLEEYSEI
jgi:metallo-beta-lactamase family protein